MSAIAKSSRSCRKVKRTLPRMLGVKTSCMLELVTVHKALGPAKYIRAEPSLVLRGK